MSTTRETISEWFDRGVAREGVTHMVVVCDTLNHEDYPVYVTSAAAAREKKANPGNMQRVMEVYCLGMNKEDQLNEHRAFHCADPPGEPVTDDHGSDCDVLAGPSPTKPPVTAMVHVPRIRKRRERDVTWGGVGAILGALGPKEKAFLFDVTVGIFSQLFSKKPDPEETS